MEKVVSGESVTPDAPAPEITNSDDALPIDKLNLIGGAPKVTETYTAPPIEPDTEKRGRGRPKGSGTAKKKTPPPADAATVHVEAETLVYLNDAALLALCGESLTPADELRAAYIAELQHYMETSGQTLPPWVKLVAIAGAYNARAFQAPTFRQRAGYMWGKVRGWFKK